MKCPANDKICARVLEKFLEGLEIFGSKRDFEMLFYSSDTALVGGKNHKTWANLDREILMKRYQEHIPRCPECSVIYTAFLEKQIDGKNPIERVDKKYLGLLPEIASSKKSAS